MVHLTPKLQLFEKLIRHQLDSEVLYSLKELEMCTVWFLGKGVNPPFSVLIVFKMTRVKAPL